jgi:hypothetical protein
MSTLMDMKRDKNITTYTFKYFVIPHYKWNLDTK